MAHFYGNLKGARGEATRCGTASSGISASVRSWSGSLTVTMEAGDVDSPMVRVSSSYGSSVGGQILFSGTLEELRTVLLDRHLKANG